MTSHVFTEDQNTMEWYIDGIPVAELKLRYEAHDALVKALENIAEACNCCGDRADLAMIAQDALDELAAAEVRNG